MVAGPRRRGVCGEPRMCALARRRLLHYVLIGGALFVAERALRRPISAPPAPLVITAGRVRALLDDYRRTTGVAPSDAEVRVLVEHAIDEELLYRAALARGLDADDASIRWQLVEKVSFLDGADEYTGDRDTLYRHGRALGLDRDDPVIRRMLVEKLRLVLKEAVAREPVSDTDLRGWLARHPDAFRAPTRVSFWHVFLSTAAGPRDAEAATLVARLRAGQTSPALAVREGAAFPVAPYLRGLASEQLATMFGPEFAHALAAAPPGQWTGPFRSAHGLHLVWVETTEPPADPPLDAIRDRVTAALRRERATTRLADVVATLRRTHAVRVEWPDGSAS